MKLEKPNIVCFGETLWDILPSGKLPGGAPMNIAIQLKNLNISTSFISKIGRDSLGKELLQYIRKKIGNTQWIQVDDIHPTGQVNVNITQLKEIKYDIASPAAWDYITWMPEMIELIKSADVLVYGTLASRNEISKNTLFKILHEVKLKVLDINLRTPYYDQKTVEELLTHADIVKMNEEELNIIAGWHKNKGDEEEKMRYLKEKFALEIFLLTKGSKGALLLDDKAIYHQPAFKIKLVDSVGCGDAFLAALLKKIFEKSSRKEILAYACALGSIVAGRQGANHYINQYEIDQILKSNVIN